MLGCISPVKYPITNKIINNTEREMRTFSAVTIFLLFFSSSVVRKNNAKARLMRTAKNTKAKNILNNTDKIVSSLIINVLQVC